MADILVMKTQGKGAPKPQKGSPVPAELKGKRQQTQTWSHWTGENGRLCSGIWEATPGKVNVDYSEWEFCHFIKGEAILKNDKGQRWILKKGDAFIIPPGFKGTWETVRKTRKHFVVLLPEPSDTQPVG